MTKILPEVMVLEEVAAAPETFRDDSSPNSDQDPYSNAGGSTGAAAVSEIKIDTTKLPRPIPFIGPLLGYNNANLGQNIVASVGNMAKIVKRPLTNEEVQALAYHTAKGVAIASWGFPVGAIGGLWRASNTRSTYRFPFWQPDLEKFNTKKFGPWTGPRAEFGWQFLRRFAYASIGGWLGKMIVGTYAATVATTGTRLDSRMKDVVIALNEEIMRRRRTSNSPAGNAQPGVNTGQDSAASYGNANPARGDRVGTITTNTGPFADNQTQRPSSQQQADYSTYGGVTDKSPAYQLDRDATQATDFDFDDASPTAGNESVNSLGDMSAWERLRKGQSPVSPQSRNASKNLPARDDRRENARGGSTQREPRDVSTAGDSFSFSRSDEERQLAQAQAQNEFDARVERERRGQDFENDRKWR